MRSDGAPLSWPLSLQLYGAGTRLISPFTPQILAGRARAGKEDAARLPERLGRPSAPRPDGPLVWVHAISVGEGVSALPLIDALAAERPDLNFLVTSGTRGSAEILSQRLPAGAIHQYIPIDSPTAVARFVGYWRPDLAIFIEAELWPNLILETRKSGARLALISARMTEQSARGWERRPPALRAMLGCFDLILAQDPGTEGRIASFRGEVAGRLNLKRMGAPLTCDPKELKALEAAVGNRPVILGASTHSPEEALVARAALAAQPDALVIIAPRNPELADVAAQNLALWRVARRTLGQPIAPDTQVYLADTMNELGLFLRVADVAVMGKSFPPEVGGHNPLEPARLGVGTISGPEFSAFSELFPEMAEAGAAQIVAGEAELRTALADLYAEPQRLADMGGAARAFAERQGNQLAASLGLIRPLLPPAAPQPSSITSRRPRPRLPALAGPKFSTPRWWYVREGAPMPVTRALFTPFSWIWTWVTAWRVAQARPVDAGVPVICVGNLTMGGSGKTPVVRAVVRQLVASGRAAHVLTRGYGGRLAGPVRVDPAVHTAADVGDEALMMARDAPVWAARDRAAGALAARAAGAEVIVMDDGHQNFSLAKQLSLVVVDGETRGDEWPFGDGAVFPAGPMREPLDAGLERADAVVLLLPADLTAPDPDLMALLEGKPVLIARLEPAATPPAGPQLAFAGIAKPWKMERALKAAGCDLADFAPFPDHAGYDQRTLRFLGHRATALGASLLTSEKDWVKLPPEWRAKVRAWPIEVRFEDAAALDKRLKFAGGADTSS